MASWASNVILIWKDNLDQQDKTEVILHTLLIEEIDLAPDPYCYLEVSSTMWR